MAQLTAEKYRELFLLRAKGELEPMECTKSLYEHLKKIYFPGMKILDIPCGVGHYLYKLKDLGDIEYYGIDRDSEAIKLAKEVWSNQSDKFHFEIGDINNLRFEDDYFDVVICYNLILHLKDYKTPIKELLRVAKSNLLIRTIISDNPFKDTIETSDDYKEVYNDLTYQFNSYSRDEIKNYVDSLGDFNVDFIPDAVEIPQEDIEKQARELGVSVDEFAQTKGKVEDWKGHKFIYEIIWITK